MINVPQSLFECLGADSLRIVGGAVRNYLLKIPVTDIDLATIHRPDVVMRKLKECGIKAIPTGIDHGTVTAAIDGQPFEITTLRADIDTDGRHATVAFTTDWTQDVHRRDFTINSLMMDRAGEIYDLTGEGLADIAARRVRFIGDPDQRIKEDYLRILRFFRMDTLYGSEIDQAAMAACARHADQISALSKERVTQEIDKLLRSDRAAYGLKNMQACDIFTEARIESLAFILNCDVTISQRLRWALVFKEHSDDFALSNKVKDFMKASVPDLQPVRAQLYYLGIDDYRDFYLYECAVNKQKPDNIIMQQIATWQKLQCPVTGNDLQDLGMMQGAALGVRLKQIEKLWVDSDFTLGRDALLKAT